MCVWLYTLWCDVCVAFASVSLFMSTKTGWVYVLYVIVVIWFYGRWKVSEY